MRIGILLSVMLVLSITFNNCGEFKAVGEDSPVASTLKPTQLGMNAAEMTDGYQISLFSPIYSLQHFSFVAQGRPNAFGVDPSKFPEGSSYNWDYDFNNGADICEQSTDPISSWKINYKCDKNGSLILTVFVTQPDSTKQKFVAQIDIQEDIGLPPPPPPPAPKTGAELYAQHCAGCHPGTVATSSKKGRTLAQIKGAIDANTGGMGSPTLRALAAGDDLKKIADALK